MDKTKMKIIVFSLLIVTGMLLSEDLPAQEYNGRPGGLFGCIPSSTSGGMMGRGRDSAIGDINGQTFGIGTTNGEIIGQTFGAPLNSGLFIMLIAGASYSAIKSSKKQNKQSRKEN